MLERRLVLDSARTSTSHHPCWSPIRATFAELAQRMRVARVLTAGDAAARRRTVAEVDGLVGELACHGPPPRG